jgi:polysaccharide biosynthesis transport protein
MQKASELSNLSWHDYWAIAARRRWDLLGPLFALGLLGCVMALVWPVRYRSEALILIEQQKVPEQYVTPNVVANIEDRLQSMTEQILSRTRLQHLIEQFNLYPRQRASMTPSEIVEMMRKDITIEPQKGSTRTGELTAFRIAYIAPDSHIAQQIVNELTSLFIDDNLRARDQQSSSTTQFLENQLTEARQHLDETEQRLREYKMQYLGELPEQEQSNLQILSSLEAQLNSSSAELDRLEQDKTYLESMNAGYKSLGPAAIASPHPGDAQPETIPELKAKLAGLQAKYTDRYPEVIRTKEEITRLQAIQQQQPKWGEEIDPAKSGGREAATADPAQPGLIEIDSRLKAVRVDIENRRKEVNSLRQRIQSAQAHLNMTPVREQQLAEVSRDYDNAKNQYQSLLQKESQSALATNLEKRQEGEQFHIIDPASLPEKPVEPNRAEISLGGWLLGLMAGIGLTAMKEVTDTRLHGEADVRKVSPLPILVSVSDLPLPWKEAVANRHRLLEAFMAALLVVTSLGVGAYLYLG